MRPPYVRQDTNLFGGVWAGGICCLQSQDNALRKPLSIIAMSDSVFPNPHQPVPLIRRCPAGGSPRRDAGTATCQPWGLAASLCGRIVCSSHAGSPAIAEVPKMTGKHDNLLSSNGLRHAAESLVVKTSQSANGNFREFRQFC